MSLEGKISARRKAGFLVMVLILGYVITSLAIAVNTVDHCGADDAAKHWRVVPPGWVCERTTF